VLGSTQSTQKPARQIHSRWNRSETAKVVTDQNRPHGSQSDYGQTLSLATGQKRVLFLANMGGTAKYGRHEKKRGLAAFCRTPLRGRGCTAKYSKYTKEMGEIPLFSGRLSFFGRGGYEATASTRLGQFCSAASFSRIWCISRVSLKVPDEEPRNTRKLRVSRGWRSLAAGRQRATGRWTCLAVLYLLVSAREYARPTRLGSAGSVLRGAFPSRIWYISRFPLDRQTNYLRFNTAAAWVREVTWSLA
jgi:hypothetical protein